MKTSVRKFREIKDQSVLAHRVSSACPGSLCNPHIQQLILRVSILAQVHQGQPTTAHLLFLVRLLSYMHEKAAFSIMHL